MAKSFLRLSYLIGTLSLWPVLAQAPVSVVATTGMIADVAQEVAGDCAQVQAMMGPGVDPHLYKAQPSDVRALNRADLILYSGYNLEGQLGEVLGALARNRPVLAIAEAAVPASETLSEPGSNATDPHLWMNVSYWARLPELIAQALADVRPECAAALLERAEQYRAQLLALDAWVRERVASIPAEQRVLVTAHDAFGYFGAAYGLEVAAVQGLSTQAEASLADVRDTVALVAQRRIPAIFVETSVNPRTIQAVLQAVAEQGGETTIGGELYSDALGTSGTPEGSYIGMILHNTTTITEALGGRSAPLPPELASWLARWPGLGR